MIDDLLGKNLGKLLQMAGNHPGKMRFKQDPSTTNYNGITPNRCISLLTCLGSTSVDQTEREARQKIIRWFCAMLICQIACNVYIDQSITFSGAYGLQLPLSYYKVLSRAVEFDQT